MYHLSSYVGQRVVAVWPRRTVRCRSAPASPRPGMSAEPGLTTDGTSRRPTRLGVGRVAPGASGRGTAALDVDSGRALTAAGRESRVCSCGDAGSPSVARAKFYRDTALSAVATGLWFSYGLYGTSRSIRLNDRPRARTPRTSPPAVPCPDGPVTRREPQNPSPRSRATHALLWLLSSVLHQSLPYHFPIPRAPHTQSLPIRSRCRACEARARQRARGLHPAGPRPLAATRDTRSRVRLRCPRRLRAADASWSTRSRRRSSSRASRGASSRCSRRREPRQKCYIGTSTTWRARAPTRHSRCHREAQRPRTHFRGCRGLRSRCPRGTPRQCRR